MGEPDGKEDPPSYYENDSVWFKPDFNSHWYRGLVEDVGRWFLWVRKLGETHLYKVPRVYHRVHHIESGSADEMRHAIARIEGARTVLRGCDPVAPGTPCRVVRVLATRVGVPLWKPRKPYRSERYLNHVRSHRCLNHEVCGHQGRSEAHHTGEQGVGQTADDYTAVNACHPCHVHATAHYCYPGRTVDETREMDREAVQRLLVEYAAIKDGVRRAA